MKRVIIGNKYINIEHISSAFHSRLEKNTLEVWIIGDQLPLTLEGEECDELWKILNKLVEE